MLRCVVPLHLIQDASCFLRRERLVQGPHCMSIEIVGDEYNLLSIRKVLIHQFLKLMGKVLCSASLGDGYSAPPSKGFTHHEDVSHAPSLVLVVLPCIFGLLFVRAGSRRQRLSACPVPSQLLVLLVHAHYRIVRVIRAFIHRQHIFHLSYELGCRDTLGRDTLGRDTLGRDTLGRDTLGRDTLGVVSDGQAPTLYLPRTKPVFFSRFITPTSEIVSMHCSSAILSLSASSCSVHLALPSGGEEQASMT